MPISYTSGRLGFRGRLAELAALYRLHRDPATEHVSGLVREARSLKSTVENMSGRPMAGLKILDVGPGSFLLQSRIFAIENDVTAIDLNVIPQGVSPLPYFRMLYQNGPLRFAKTLGRKIAGIDRCYNRRLKELLGISSLPKVRVVQGDVASMRFPDASFDIVNCRAVLNSVMEPERAIGEIARVTTAGGFVHISLHLYTSYNGSLAPDVIGGQAEETLYWAHLRNEVKGNATLNKLRVAQWKQIFSAHYPGHVAIVHESDRPGIKEAAEKMIASGRFRGYTADELVCHALEVFWKKPN